MIVTETQLSEAAANLRAADVAHQLATRQQSMATEAVAEAATKVRRAREILEALQLLRHHANQSTTEGKQA